MAYHSVTSIFTIMYVLLSTSECLPEMTGVAKPNREHCEEELLVITPQKCSAIIERLFSLSHKQAPVFYPVTIYFKQKYGHLI
jgi:hypothetical protein